MLDFEDLLFEGIKFNASAKASFNKKPSASASAKKPATAPSRPTIQAQARASVPAFSWPKPSATVAFKPTFAASKPSAIAARPVFSWPKPALSSPSISSPVRPSPILSSPIKPSFNIAARAFFPASNIKPISAGQLSGAQVNLAQPNRAQVNLAQPNLARINLATKITGNAISRLAAKAPLLPIQPARQIQQKAMETVAPIARACNCSAAPVIKKLNKRLTMKGYPENTASSLLAGIHDMNQSLEKAAIQRIATHEHKSINNEQAFRCKVLRKLSQLAKCLPECHPARTRAHLTILKQG